MSVLKTKVVSTIKSGFCMNYSLKVLLLFSLLLTTNKAVQGQSTDKRTKVSERLENLLSLKDDPQIKFVIDSIQQNDANFYSNNLDLILRIKGECTVLKHDYPEAFKLYFDALKFAESKKNELEVVKNKTALGMVFLNFSEDALAVKMFDESEVLARRLNEKSLAAYNGYLKGIAYKRMGDFELSNKTLEAVHTNYAELQDSAGMAKTNNALGVNYKNLKDAERAIAHFEKAILIFESLKMLPQLAKAYNNIGNIYKIDEKWDLSLLNLNNSLMIKKKRGDSLGIAVSYMNVGMLYNNMGDLNTALAYSDSCITILEKYRDIAERQLLGAYELTASIHEKMAHTEEALHYSQLVIQLLSKSRINDEKLLIELFEKKQDVKFYTISDSLLKNQEILQTKFDEVQIENQSLTEENSQVYNTALLIVSLLLLGIVCVITWKFLSTKRIKDQLELTNKELYETRISKEEKEVLLQEIHHRVKNNMQIISSLIRLQTNQSSNDDLINLFTETQNRINSMALVHEQLYKTKSFEKLELKDYLTELSNHLILSYKTEAEVERKVNISFNKADIDYIIPIGLIANEIISNSMKHGFKGREKGEICVEFVEDKTGYVLNISDNGIGDEQDSNNTGSLGLELIDSLVEQIDGTYSLEKKNGYHYSIAIPKIQK